MKYRQLGTNGLDVSEIGFGASTISGQGTYGSVNEADGIAAILQAYELGVTFFDTAEGYAEGRSEIALGKALGSKKDVVICTKVGGRAGPFTSTSIRGSVEASLRRLRRDAIDVYLLHNPETDQIKDPSIQEALQLLKQDGLIRGFGVSCVTRNCIEQGEEVTVKSPWGQCKMVAYVTDHIHPRVVSAPFGWHYPEKGEAGLFGDDSPNINLAVGVDPPNDPNIGVAYLKPLMCDIVKTT